MVKQDLMRLCSPYCPSSCEAHELKTYVSPSNYPTSHQFNSLMNKSEYLQSLENETSRNEIKKSLIYLRIFYDELKYEYIYQIPKMLITDLVSIVGGTLSVSLGMSFLSIFEVITLFIDIIVNRWNQ